MIDFTSSHAPRHDKVTTLTGNSRLKFIFIYVLLDAEQLGHLINREFYDLFWLRFYRWWPERMVLVST